MKILHTSDWHLGKKLFKRDRLEEQRLFLEWLLSTIKSEKIDVLVIAGDIFDTAIPSTEALSTFFQFLKDCEISSLKNGGHLKKVLAIGGNHDNARLIETPRPFLDPDFYKIVGRLTYPSPEEIKTQAGLQKWQDQYSCKVIIKSENEDINKEKEYLFALLPFFRPRELMAVPCQEKENIEDTLLLQLDTWLETLQRDQKGYPILISHHVFGSFLASGSEQGVALSGLDSLPMDSFKNWELLMLGHIHKKQVIKKESPFAVYSGSPYPLRFSESNKKVTLIHEIKDGILRTTEIENPLFRGLFRVSATKEDYLEKIIKLLKENPPHFQIPHFLELEITAEKSSPYLADEVRADLKELPIEIINFYTKLKNQTEKQSPLSLTEVSNKTTPELFDLFLEGKEIETNLKGELKETLKECLQEIENEEEQ